MSDLPKGFIAHKGGKPPIVSKVRAYFRDGLCLEFAMKPTDWNGRWEWYGKPKKRDDDIIGYQVKP